MAGGPLPNNALAPQINSFSLSPLFSSLFFLTLRRLSPLAHLRFDKTGIVCLLFDFCSAHIFVTGM